MSTFLQRFRRFWRYNGLPAGRRGFTLIELLVVTLIMVLITSTILVRQARFDSATLLRSLSYSIALSIRSAQVYGTSVRGATTDEADCAGNFASGICYAAAYGVYFSSGDPTHYFLFADLDDDGVRTPGLIADGGEDLQVYTIGSGFQVSKLCLTIDGAQHCSTDGGSGKIASLTVYFKRPNPEAHFVSNLTGSSYDNAYIQVQSSSDKTNTHAIAVTQTGQIAVLAAGN